MIFHPHKIKHSLGNTLTVGKFILFYYHFAIHTKYTFKIQKRMRQGSARERKEANKPCVNFGVFQKEFLRNYLVYGTQIL